MAARLRRTLLALMLLAVAGAAAAALAAAHRRGLVERLLLWELGRRGIGDASLTVAQAGLRELVVRNVRLGDGDLELGALELRFTPEGLAAGRLDAARVEGLRLRGRVDEEGLSLGALDALRRAGAPGRRDAVGDLPLLPVGRLEVDGSTLTLETPHGRFEATLAVDLDEQGRGTFRGATGALAAIDTPLGVAAAPFALVGDVAFDRERFELELEPAPFSLSLATRAGPQPLTGTTPRLSLRGRPGDAALEIAGSGGELALLAPGVTASGIAFELRIEPATRLPRGSLRIARLGDLRRSVRFTPFALEASLAPDAGRLAFEGVLRSATTALEARFAGAHDPAAGAGRVALRAAPLRFALPGPAPGDLVPALAPLVRSAQGEVELGAELRWSAGGVDATADLGLREVALQLGAALLERVNAALHFENLSPLRTAPGQLVSMARVDFGLELTDGLVRGAVLPGGVLDLEQAQWSFAGGSVRTAGRFDPFAARRELVLTVADVDLAELLALAPLDGLQGSGRLGGRLPLSFAAGALRIAEGELRASDEGGWIRYRPHGRVPEALGAAGDVLDDLLLALRDFHYEKLSLRVDGDPQGEVTVAISLAGANPAHRGGQPYALNLNLEGRLGDLIRQARASYRVPQEIEKRLEELSRRRSVDAGPARR